MTASSPHVKGIFTPSLEKTFMSSEKQKRFNITLSENDAALIKELQTKLNKELMMELSMAQVVRRLLKQATAALNS